MHVETYEIHETTGDGQTDTLDADAVALIERMQLAGQQRLVSARSSAPAAVLPYQAMTAEEIAVYSLLFPQTDKLGDYSAGPIPLRVLQAAALCVERGWFARLEVWHKRTGSAKEDPLLVGVVAIPVQGIGGSTWTRDVRYLIARWGDALRPFRELVAEAATVARGRVKAAIEKARAEIDSAARMAEVLDDAALIRWAHREPSVVSADPPRD